MQRITFEVTYTPAQIVNMLAMMKAVDLGIDGIEMKSMNFGIGKPQFETTITEYVSWKTPQKITHRYIQKAKKRIAEAFELDQNEDFFLPCKNKVHSVKKSMILYW